MDKLVAFFLALLISGTLSLPLPALAQDREHVTTIVLQKDQTINKDYFAAGDTVTLAGTVNGDAYVAGGNVIVEGVINGDLLAAGGTITMRGKVRDNVRVAGGQIVISGDVGRNVTTLGGSVTIADAAKIDGSLAAGTGNLSIFAPIGKEANFAAGQATLGNTINGDVQAGVGQFSLTPDAKILGNLTYWSDATATLNSNQIAGKTTHNLPPQPQREQEKIAKSPAAFAGLGVAFGIIGFLGALVVGLLLTTFLPVFTKQTAATIQQKPLQSLGVGFLSIILAPFVFVLLLVTVIGIPLDFILLAGFLICVYLAKIFVSIAIGQKTLTFLKKQTSLRWTFVLGLLLYSVLTMLPLLGFVFWMIAGLMGLGALFIERQHIYTSLRKKNLI